MEKMGGFGVGGFEPAEQPLNTHVWVFEERLELLSRCHKM